MNIIDIKESRHYTVLSYAAFKNHDKCFAVAMKHAIEYNLPKDLPTYVKKKIIEWVD